MDKPFSTILLQHPSGATASLCSYGAHLTSWKLANGEEKLFLSSKAIFKEGSSIRGGVPIIFPQFNEFGDGPRHGFARTSQWAIIQSPKLIEDTVECELRLCSSEATKKLWPFEFQAFYKITLSENALSLQLRIKNIGLESFSFTAALHSYFNISQINDVVLHGLSGRNYWDNNGANFSDRQVASENQLLFSDALDRIYFDVENTLSLTDPNASDLTLSHNNFKDVVVWNPGKAATAQMKDMSDSEYQNMLCIEAAIIDKPVFLKPEDEWVGIQSMAAS